ncbi:MAG: hypothetical protein MI923_00430 [Phycisphaerales bacterium]|nr:hypothetical protein [Phycisphaerales bacterium]
MIVKGDDTVKKPTAKKATRAARKNAMTTFARPGLKIKMCLQNAHA